MNTKRLARTTATSLIVSALYVGPMGVVQIAVAKSIHATVQVVAPFFGLIRTFDG